MTIHQGQILGYARNPNNWLDQTEKMKPKQLESCRSHAGLIGALAQKKFESRDPAAAIASETENEEVLGGVII